jgi:penicillin-binding protein 2
METLVQKVEPEVLYTIEDKSGITFSSIKQGMIKAAQFVPYAYPTEDEYFSDYLLTSLPEKAAIKTGTPQMNTAVDTGSAFIGYYPADDPVITFSGFVEHGEWSKLMVKQIIEAYLYEDYQVNKVSRVFTPESILAGLQESE